MSNFSKQLGAQVTKSAGLGGMIGKGLGMAERFMPRMGNMAQNVMRGAAAGAGQAAHAVPTNFDPSTMGGLFHTLSNNFSKGIGGAIGGISRGMAGTNIPGVRQLGNMGVGMAGSIGHAAPTLGMGATLMNHFNNGQYNNLMDNASGAIDQRDQYINQLLQQQQAHNGSIGNWLSQYI